MNIFCIRHVAFEGPGIIGDWAEKNGYNFKTIKAYEGERLPAAQEVDALVVMGGPMGANDDHRYPWLSVTKALIGDALQKDVPVLGICLGAQLLAGVLGSTVRKNTEKEIGWFPVELTEAGRLHRLTSHLPLSFTTFHWHGDTFDLPEGSVHLLSSVACRHQAFVYNKALGLQFHMEMREKNIEEVAERCSGEFVEAPYIQRREAIYNHPDMDFNHFGLRKILDAWIKQ